VPGSLPKQRARLARAVPLLPLLAMLALPGCRWPWTPDKQQLLQMALAPATERREAILLCRRALQQDARFGGAWERLAALQWEEGDAEASFASLTRAAELMSDRLDLMERLAMLQYQMYFADPGRPRVLLQEIEDLSDRMRARWPRRAEGYRYQALALAERHRLDEALAAIENGLGQSGEDAELIVQRASILFRQGHTEPATAQLRALVEKGTRYRQTYELLYLQLMQAHRTAEAGSVLEAKYRAVGDADSGLQHAAHLYAAGSRDASRELLLRLAERFSTQSDILARTGDFWLNRGELEPARDCYDQGLRRFAASRSLYVSRLVEWRLAREERPEARALLDSELKKTPKDDTLLAWRVVLDAEGARADRLRTAQLELEAVASRMPNSAFVRYHLGRVYLQLGDLARAGQSLERSVRLDPNYAPGWLALVQADLARGNWSLAQSRMHDLLARAPGYGPALVTQARLDAQRGDYTRATGVLNQLSGPSGFMAEVAFTKAEIQLMKGDTGGAARSFEQVAQQGVLGERALLELARLDVRQGHAQKGLDRLAAALERQPDSISLRLARAALALECGASDTALTEFRALLARQPGQSEFHTGAADALALGGHWREARAEYEKALAAGQASGQTLIHYAALLTAMQEPAKAEDTYRLALARDGNNPYALNNLSYLLARRGDQLPYALQLAQQAGRVLPGSEEVQDTLAYVYLKMGMRAEAAEVFDRLAQALPPARRGELQNRARQIRARDVQQTARDMELARDRRAETPKGAAL
jgi:tetratricopeptide (TPR) repeat protein